MGKRQLTDEQLSKRRSDAFEMAEVMRDYSEGKTIEFRARHSDPAWDNLPWAATLTPQWDWREMEYRTKPCD